MVDKRIGIDDLIEIVAKGGKVKTGIDVYDKSGILLLERDILVDKIKILEIIKANGIESLPLSAGGDSGIWDADGKLIGGGGAGTEDGSGENREKPKPLSSIKTGEIEKKLYQIEELKKIALEKYNESKDKIKKILGDIKETGGEFDYGDVEEQVSDLVEFLTVTDNSFSYLTKEILSYDDYLYNHSVNVCAIGTAIINKFNASFSLLINDHLNAGIQNQPDLFKNQKKSKRNSYKCFMKDELLDIATGFFLHDLGKVLVPDKVLNKAGRLTSEEFETVKKHSYEFGPEIMEKNNIKNSMINNIVKNHHARLYEKEERCYPNDTLPDDIPIYVKICKFADIYDAMTSKRCYKEAFNQISVVTDIFRKYAGKDILLQHILYAFVKSIGIYPPGSIIFLRNGQMAYILESEGPIVIPFTDSDGNRLTSKSDPVDINSPDLDELLKPDGRRSVKTPMEVYDLLPSYLKGPGEKLLINK